MRFMVIVRATKDSEAGNLPSAKLLEDMGRFNQELAEAGILLAADGLKSSASGARVRFSGNTRTVTDGPFDPNELIAGYWIWKVSSREEAIEWVKRCPNPFDVDSDIEIRQIYEVDDFAPVMSPALQQEEELLRIQVGEPPIGA